MNKLDIVMVSFLMFMLLVLAGVQIYSSHRWPHHYIWTMTRFDALKSSTWFVIANVIIFSGRLLTLDLEVPLLAWALWCVIAAVISFVYMWTLWFRAFEKMHYDYVKKHPGGCVCCAFYVYGVQHGFAPPGTQIPKHECPSKTPMHSVEMRESR